MNLDEYQGASHRATDWLAAMVEEAIAETVALPRRNADLREPPGAEGFLADAAAFLRTRPDAAELLTRLQAMIEPVAGARPEPPEAEQCADEAAPEVLPREA